MRKAEREGMGGTGKVGRRMKRWRQDEENKEKDARKSQREGAVGWMDVFLAALALVTGLVCRKEEEGKRKRAEKEKRRRPKEGRVSGVSHHRCKHRSESCATTLCTLLCTLCTLCTPCILCTPRDHGSPWITVTCTQVRSTLAELCHQKTRVFISLFPPLAFIHSFIH